MDLFFLYSLMAFVFKDPNNIINGNLPSCSRCIHYRNSFTIGIPLDNHFGKCTKFGTKDIITGKIIYDYADNIRNDENKCGQDGFLFEPRKFPYSVLDKMCENKKNNKSKN